MLTVSIQNEGKPNSVTARNAAYGGGALKFFEILQNWRQDGKLSGLECEMFEGSGDVETGPR